MICINYQNRIEISEKLFIYLKKVKFVQKIEYY